MWLTKGFQALKVREQLGDKVEGPLGNDLLYLKMESQ